MQKHAHSTVNVVNNLHEIDNEKTQLRQGVSLVSLSHLNRHVNELCEKVTCIYIYVRTS